MSVTRINNFAECYLREMLSLPSGEPQGKDGNQKIRDKCKQYLDRVEELQEYLVNKEVVTEIKYIIFVLQMLT